MKQNSTTKEAKSQVDKRLRLKFTSLTKSLLWLITNFVMFLVSLASLTYFYLRGSKSRKEDSNTARPLESKQLSEDIINANSDFDTLVEKTEQSQQKRSSNPKWSEASNIRFLSDLILGQVKKVAGPLVALVIAYFAQGIFDSTTGGGVLRNWVWLISMSESSRLWLGAGMYLISVLIWVFTAPSIQSIGVVTDQSDSFIAQKTSYQPVRFFLLVTSIGIYFLSIVLYLTSGENGFIRGLWVAGLICFILSQIPWFGNHAISHPEADESPRFRWQNWLVLAVILGVAFWLRFYQLDTIPYNLHGDMASYGLVARDYLLGVEKNIFGYSFYDIPVMGFLPTIFSMGVFGNNLFGLQMTAVLGGLLSLLAVYLLTWRLFNSHRLALLTTTLTSINIAHIHFSRIAAYMDPWLFGYFALFFLIDGLKARRASSFGLAGFF